jgi:hypothetical protein
MQSMPSSLANFDQTLIDEYVQHRSQFASEREALNQRRFAQYRLFPKLGWALIGIGEAQALSSRDARVLYDTMARFIKCAHHCWGPVDERGLHWGGDDFCSLVVPSLYSALLGKSYLASIFHCGRPMSATGYGAYLHAANLMVSLECKDWPFSKKAVARAQSYVASKSKPVADRAFVGFFVAVLAHDRSAIKEALLAFSDGYLKSDWGRHKLATRETFIQAMVTYARGHVADAIDAQTHSALMSEDRIALWNQVLRELDVYARTPHQFPAPIDFLNDLSPQ